MRLWYQKASKTGSRGTGVAEPKSESRPDFFKFEKGVCETWAARLWRAPNERIMYGMNE